MSDFIRSPEDLRRYANIPPASPIPETSKPLRYEIARALAYAVTQISADEPSLRRIVIQEFWHSLNRKGLIENQGVEVMINHTYDLIKQGYPYVPPYRAVPDRF